MTKKKGNIYKEICSVDNVRKGLKDAVRHKSRYKVVRDYKSNPSKYEDELSEILSEKKFKVSEYTIMEKVTDNGKLRIIPKVPLFYDQAVQHCLLNHTWHEQWIKTLTDDCYNCIPKRGINSKVDKWNMTKKLKRDLLKLSKCGHVYFGKCDIRKHYPTVRHSVYRRAYNHDIKDKDVLNLYDKLNYSIEGLPIGWATGAPSSHIILRELDHWVKEEIGIQYYYRFADDIVFLSLDKKQLHEWMWRIRNFMWYRLKQEMKGNYKVCPIEEGIDFGGYVFRVGHTRLRKSIKKHFVKKRHNPKSMASYMGILKYCDSKDLITKVVCNDNKHMTSIKDIGVKIDKRFWGKPIKISGLEDEPIKILDFEVRPSIKEEGKLWMRMQIDFRGTKRFVKTSAQDIAKFLQKVDPSLLPLEDVVIKKDDDNSYYIDGTISD